MSEHVDLLRRLFRAFADGDAQTIEAALAPDVRAHTPGRNVLSGTVEGRSAVLQQLGRSGQLTGGTYRIEVEDVMGGDGHASVLYRATGAREGRKLDVRHLALYAIDAGHITEIWFVPLDQPAFDAFWA